MPAYSYRAVDFAGRIARGNVAAANEWELAQNLSQSGLELIEARTKKETPAARRFRLPQRLPPRALARFASQMGDLLLAGISLPESLREAGRAAEHGALRDALDDIYRAVNHGSTLAEAFARHPRLFPGVFNSILAAGERSGDLVTTFDHLTRYAEARARTIEQLRRAVRYPLFLLIVACGVIIFMSTMVIPQILQFLTSFNTSLPLSTRILVAVSSVAADYWWAAGIVMLAAGGAVHFVRRHSESAAKAIDALLLRVPLIGQVIRKLALARFTHSFAILFQSGIGIVDSLRGASLTLGNRALAGAVDDATRQIQSGRALSASMIGIFPPFAVHMMQIGERSGKLTKALNNIAVSCDREVSEVTTRLIGAMEPGLTILIGGILAWIVLAVLGPIYGNIATVAGSG